MRTKFVGWALAHRDKMVRQNPTLQHCSCRCRIRFTPHGFSIERVLLIVSIIVIVFSVIILPSIPHRPKSHAYVLKQLAQLRSIDCALELFRSDCDYYPPSGPTDDEGRSYCGAMKLCEALMGRDLQGFNPNSKFKADSLDDSGASLYNPNTFEARKGPYLPEENANAYHLKDLYKNFGPFDGNEYILCDELRRVKYTDTGRKIGMPVLYYKANMSKTAHDINDPNNPENIYDYRDNHALLALGVPGKLGQKHPLYENPKIFYEMTLNTKISGQSRPYRADTYILLSAGLDGLYGTKDDIANFDMRWKP